MDIIFMNIFLTNNLDNQQKSISFKARTIEPKQCQQVNPYNINVNKNIQSCTISGSQIIQLHNKQDISFKGSAKY